MRCTSCSILFAACLTLGCSSRKIERVEWTTMSTMAAVQVRGGDAACLTACRDAAQAACRDVEKCLNAFDPQSELSRLAPLPDAHVLTRCDPAMRPCYAAAFRFRGETAGAFNPRWRGTNTLDLGAIAKGFAVDLAVERIAKLDVRGADVLVDIGGNLRSVRGVWRVGIYESDQTLILRADMACATSGTCFRGNHIVDGRTGEKAALAASSVTVVHPTSAMLADALSTTLFILGRDAGTKFLATHYPTATVYWR